MVKTIFNVKQQNRKRIWNALDSSDDFVFSKPTQNDIRKVIKSYAYTRIGNHIVCCHSLSTIHVTILEKFFDEAHITMAEGKELSVLNAKCLVIFHLIFSLLLLLLA